MKTLKNNEDCKPRSDRVNRLVQQASDLTSNIMAQNFRFRFMSQTKGDIKTEYEVSFIKKGTNWVNVRVSTEISTFLARVRLYITR